MFGNGRRELVIGISCQWHSFSCWQNLQPWRCVRKNLDIDAHRIHVLQTICPQILLLGAVSWSEVRSYGLANEIWYLFSYGFLNRSITKMFFKCNKFHVVFSFPFPQCESTLM